MADRFACGSWETQINDFSWPIKVETTLVLISHENITSQCVTLKAKSVQVLQTDIYTSTQVSTSIQ